MAPKGTGAIKIGGNYAASLNAGQKAHELGYSVMLYLDPKENKYLDECGAANFFGVKGNTYVTPNSRTVLPSITNKSLRTLAEDLGLKVEQREIPLRGALRVPETGTCRHRRRMHGHRPDRRPRQRHQLCLRHGGSRPGDHEALPCAAGHPVRRCSRHPRMVRDHRTRLMTRVEEIIDRYYTPGSRLKEILTVHSMLVARKALECAERRRLGIDAGFRGGGSPPPRYRHHPLLRPGHPVRGRASPISVTV